MDTLFFILSGLSAIAIFIFVFIATIHFGRKNKSKGKKQLMFAGASLIVMIVTFTGFMFTFEVPEEEKIDVVETVAKSEEESSTNTSDDTMNKEQTVNTENSQKQPQATKDNQKEDTKPETEPSKPSTLTIGEKNAELNPAKPGAMLYDKTESKFKGMEYYFKGEIVGVKSLEGLFGNMEDALLIKNDQGYVLPVFPPYEIDVSIGDTVEVSGSLSGDGYAASDLGVSNVVGMTGAMNATQISIDGETQ